jgi:hypothetical protein
MLESYPEVLDAIPNVKPNDMKQADKQTTKDSTPHSVNNGRTQHVPEQEISLHPYIQPFLKMFHILVECPIINQSTCFFVLFLIN